MNWQIIVGAFLLIGGIGSIRDNIGSFVVFSVIGIALLYFGLFKKGFFKSSKSNATRTLKEETFHAAGVYYYEDNIKKLAYLNSDWKLRSKEAIQNGKAGKRIFHYNYVNRPIKLQPEPNNENDKNAVAVFIAGELVGYISRSDNIHVKDILQNHDVKSISGFIGGGEYKVFENDGTISKDTIAINVNIRIKYV